MENERVIKIFDTTLRDGTQAEGFSLGVKDKITVAHLLDDLGVHYIEGGWPGSNPRDEEFFQLMQHKPLKNAKLCAFGATHHKKFHHASDCPSLQKTVQSGVSVASIFGKTWDLHSSQLLGLNNQENKIIIKNSVAFLKAHGLEVIFDAEHFFDGFFANKNFALDMLAGALEGGADNISLCDTNGGMLPHQIQEAVEDVIRHFPETSLGIHVHNDGELAVANSLIAIENGVDMIQGTINGIGERCGNANLCSLIPNIEWKMGYQSIGKQNIKKLQSVSERIAARANYTVPKNLPFVGSSAFAHKGGIHVSAVAKNPASYESINPAYVGNTRKITISDLSGKSNLKNYAVGRGYDLSTFSEEFWSLVLNDIKAVEKNGTQFEGAEHSFDLFFDKRRNDFISPFVIDDFFVHTSRHEEQGHSPVEATVKGHVDHKKFHTAGTGSGPVGALDDAIRKGLTPFFPEIKNILLTDFKVRITEMESGTGAKTRVVMEHSDGVQQWNTVGVSQNIIEASLQALSDAYEWYLAQTNESK